MPPDARRVADAHRETGVSGPTLYAWRRELQGRGRAVPADPADPESWSGQDKLAVVIETAALNEQALSEYCRRKGPYPEQIEGWKEARPSRPSYGGPTYDVRRQVLRARPLVRHLLKTAVF